MIWPMRPRRRASLLAATAIAAALPLAGCGTGGVAGGSAASGAQPIVIGISLPLTGMFQADGVAFEQGYRLWQSDVNAHGGLLGRPVKLIILNDNSSPTKVVTDYQRLITVDHVALTFGPFSSLLTAQAAPEAAKYGYAMIEGAGGAETVFTAPSNEKHHNVFDPSLPVIDYMKPLVNWLASLPPSARPKTAAYPSADDPFATPAVQEAKRALSQLGIRTVYYRVFPEKQSAYKKPAEAVAASGAQIVVLGSTDVPTVATFMQVFEQQHYTPKLFIAASGPDQGQAFLNPVGKANANGMMVPTGWYGSYANALSTAMVEEYIAKYGGTDADVNADVAEAFSVGEVAADAVRATHGTSNAAIIRYLHGLKTPLQTVQGPVLFDSLGRNNLATGFVSQWQNGNFVQVLPVGFPGSVKMLYPKPVWGT